MRQLWPRTGSTRCTSDHGFEQQLPQPPLETWILLSLGSSGTAPCTHLLLHHSHLLLGQLLQLNGRVVGMCLHLLLQLEAVLVHLGLQLVLQGDQLLLVLAPHPLIS